MINERIEADPHVDAGQARHIRELIGGSTNVLESSRDRGPHPKPAKPRFTDVCAHAEGQEQVTYETYKWAKNNAGVP
jgi:hypothetical protein